MKRLGFATTSLALTTLAAVLSLGSQLITPSGAEAAMEPHFTAKIYDLKDHSKHMFDYKSEMEITGDTKTLVNTVTDLKGDVLVIEKTILKDGGKTLVSFEQDQKQLQTVGKLEVRDGKVFFSFTKDGKAKTDDEKAGADFVVTSTLVAYVQAHWEKLAKDEAVKVRLGVLDRLETVGFQFRKEGDTLASGGPGLRIKMKPSSMIISALVNPLYFSFSADGAQLKELEGRTNVKVMANGTYKDFDGYTVYTYPVAQAAPTMNESTPAPAPSAKSKPAKKK